MGIIGEKLNTLRDAGRKKVNDIRSKLRQNKDSDPVRYYSEIANELISNDSARFGNLAPENQRDLLSWLSMDLSKAGNDAKLNTRSKILQSPKLVSTLMSIAVDSNTDKDVQDQARLCLEKAIQLGSKKPLFRSKNQLLSQVLLDSVQGQEGLTTKAKAQQIKNLLKLLDSIPLKKGDLSGALNQFINQIDAQFEGQLGTAFKEPLKKAFNEFLNNPEMSAAQEIYDEEPQLAKELAETRLKLFDKVVPNRSSKHPLMQAARHMIGAFEDEERTNEQGQITQGKNSSRNIFAIQYGKYIRESLDREREINNLQQLKRKYQLSKKENRQISFADANSGKSPRVANSEDINKIDLEIRNLSKEHENKETEMTQVLSDLRATFKNLKSPFTNKDESGFRGFFADRLFSTDESSDEVKSFMEIFYGLDTSNTAIDMTEITKGENKDQEHGMLALVHDKLRQEHNELEIKLRQLNVEINNQEQKLTELEDTYKVPLRTIFNSEIAFDATKRVDLKDKLKEFSPSHSSDAMNSIEQANLTAEEMLKKLVQYNEETKQYEVVTGDPVYKALKNRIQCFPPSNLFSGQQNINLLQEYCKEMNKQKQNDSKIAEIKKNIFQSFVRLDSQINMSRADTVKHETTPLMEFMKSARDLKTKISSAQDEIAKTINYERSMTSNVVTTRVKVIASFSLSQEHAQALVSSNLTDKIKLSNRTETSINTTKDEIDKTNQLLDLTSAESQTHFNARAKTLMNVEEAESPAYAYAEKTKMLHQELGFTARDTEKLRNYADNVMSVFADADNDSLTHMFYQFLEKVINIVTVSLGSIKNA